SPSLSYPVLFFLLLLSVPCNPCLDAAKACNLNDTCKRQRSAYIAICTKATPPQLALANQEPCSRKRCQKALRQFLERVSWEFSYPLLFCSCRDQACAERRRQTIVPACSHQERHKPTCTELRRTYAGGGRMGSRWGGPLPPGTCGAEPPHPGAFHPWAPTPRGCRYPHPVTTGPTPRGSDVTPNYSDNSPTNITISLWCTCRGTGNHERDCDAFHRDFTHNSCLSESRLLRVYTKGVSVTPSQNTFEAWQRREVVPVLHLDFFETTDVCFVSLTFSEKNFMQIDSPTSKFFACLAQTQFCLLHKSGHSEVASCNL
uniref:GDNF family receptor alpha 2b n=1 Tax=Gadus morhua TaxID=8049 RepID=A0A8C5D1E4_GADMO